VTSGSDAISSSSMKGSSTIGIASEDGSPNTNATTTIAVKPAKKELSEAEKKQLELLQAQQQELLIQMGKDSKRNKVVEDIDLLPHDDGKKTSSQSATINDDASTIGSAVDTGIESGGQAMSTQMSYMSSGLSVEEQQELFIQQQLEIQELMQQQQGKTAIKATTFIAATAGDAPAPVASISFTAPRRITCAEQDNTCACRATITEKTARLCHNCGKNYCSKCHANDVHVVPHKLCSTLDNKSYKVCRFCHQYLSSAMLQPTVNIGVINFNLYSDFPKLQQVRQLRQKVSELRPFVLSCPQRELLLDIFEGRRHLIADTDLHLYCLQDLVEVPDDKLQNFLRNGFNKIKTHITETCPVCRGKGFVCEGCNNNRDIIFPFQDNTIQCGQCRSLYHKACYKDDSKCSKCERIANVRRRNEAAASGGGGGGK
jgi:hypothetical protein